MKTVFLLLTLIVVVCNGDIIENERNLDWWETAIFYQIDIRYFADSNGDGIGDLNGITLKLEYIKDIGVDAFSISPIYNFTYDISDFDTLHNEYGTMKDFEALIEKSKELEIKVILGYVLNHTSNESFWFQEALKGNKIFSIISFGKMDLLVKMKIGNCRIICKAVLTEVLRHIEMKWKFFIYINLSIRNLL